MRNECEDTAYLVNLLYFMNADMVSTNIYERSNCAYSRNAPRNLSKCSAPVSNAYLGAHVPAGSGGLRAAGHFCNRERKKADISFVVMCIKCGEKL